ncbi:4'-phosphopantetheinyl transferase [Amycolatopsis arida]|uniref:4'-phosphopantetheinyl transferase n=1 Tax=Amycolatopsis arida TaxID=587909 RepID=A0A1I5QGK3_9PSEU|nr:4'-phosphopantetheinyl transferase superfamily protein [Amycolatopsis arida]TDX98828.1 4'-phosphopantetheinyl transferase [Amycolatopsis arida]SFP45171.1 4'-phosphopantetheinyl transferase [Amycolatopsis arida]
MIECAVWWSTPLPNAEEFLALLTAEEVERHRGYRQEADRRRFLTGRVLAKTLAGERLGRPPAAVVFDATCDDCGKPHGVPRVPGSSLRLSISHSGERIGVALTEAAPVGLDVETVTRGADDSLIDYALNDTERGALRALPDADRTDAFFSYWTRKEAVMKATGRGLRIPLRSLTLSAPGTPAALLASTDAALSPATTRMADLEPGEGYRAAVAVLGDGELRVTERWWRG